MAKVATAYRDDRGAMHPTPKAAVLADLTVVLGRIGAGSGMTKGLAQVVLEKRSEIERVFADFDSMQAHQEKSHEQ